MACPFFAPQRRLDPGPWTHRPRLPLGDACFGFCHAPSVASFAPPEEHQRELCNRGYARGFCEHFPVSGAADAVRFSVADDHAGRLRVIYILEKDHAPQRHGSLEFRTAGFPARDAAADDLLMRQARAFVESYLKLVEESKIPAQ